MTRLSHVIHQTVDPRYTCSRCSPDWNDEHDRERVKVGTYDCPKCPLTIARAQLWTGPPGARGLAKEWEALVDAAGDARAEEPALARAYAAVREATGALAEGQRVDPTWPVEFAALADAYYQGADQFEREQRWGMRPKGGA
jgi:ribosomal protein L37AE/L43A